MTDETAAMDLQLARTLWHRLEAVNAVTYFAHECREAPTRLGLKGFWMGYFACRAAPMGPVSAGVVEATFHNFHPERVRRSVPEAWSRADPAAVLDARASAAAAALRRIVGGSDIEELAAFAIADLRAACEAGDPAGRALFAANRDVPVPDDPVAALWQAATTLREHRGDGHVAILTSEDVDGCEAHVLAAAATGTPAEMFLQSRGWSPDDWGAATERLAARGLVRGEDLTVAGRELRLRIEDRTDELAAVPYTALGADRPETLAATLGPVADTIAASGEITFPNPMGLPAPQ